VTLLAAIRERAPFRHGPYEAFHNEWSGAYEVMQDGRTIALAWPGRPAVINPAFIHAELLEGAFNGPREPNPIPLSALQG
jgi:hypothetical protein